MATQTLANYDAVLKDVYRGPIVDQLNQETWLIDQIERENANDMGQFNGRRLIFPVHSGRNRGRGAGTDGGTLPTAGRQAYQDGIVTIKSMFQAIEVTDQLIKQASSNEAAFIKAVTSEIEGATTDLRKDISRQCYGTGDGLLASCTATQNATTISVDSGQFIAVGDTVDVLTRSNGTVKGAALTVTAVAYTGAADGATQANADITLSGSVSVTNADGVFIAGDRNNETDGLRNITAASRTLHAINSATAGNQFWDGNVKQAAWGSISEDLLMQLAQVARQRATKGIDVFLGTLGIQRRLANTYQSQKRWNDANAVKTTGGYSAIMVAAGNSPVPFVADVDAPVGWTFALRKDTFCWSEIEKPNWLTPPDGDAGMFHLKDGSSAGTKQAIWQAWLGWYATLVNVRPQANGQISQLKDDIPVARA